MREAAGTFEVTGLIHGIGRRLTPQRRAIVAAVVARGGCISPTTLIEEMRESMPGVASSTVYRTLSLLEDVGMLKHFHGEEGVGYHLAREPEHVHLRCSSCGRRWQVALPNAAAVARAMERHLGFQPDLTHFELTGVCEGCRRGDRKNGETTAPRTKPRVLSSQAYP